jgi:CRP-like cAMP-binding protein
VLQLGTVVYRPNSYIFVEDTPATDYFLIIQRGNVRCYHETFVPGSAPYMLGAGDFVGVISCMTGHTQNETVVAATDVIAIVVKRTQYSDLIAQNTSIAMKIVRAFAKNMRQVNDSLTRATTNKTNIESSEQLYNIANFFENNGNEDAAVYGYYQYLKKCPNGLYKDDAIRHFKALKPRTTQPYLEPDNAMLRGYNKGNMIFSESQPGAEMFIIQEGVVRISKVVDGKEITLALLKKGDMFGEMALLENKPRSACAIAHEACKVMVVNRANFDMMVSTQAQLISRLTTTLADRLWTMYRQLVNTQLSDPRERMIDMLALQIESKKISAPKGSTCKTSFTPLDIFNLCALDETTMPQTIALFSRDQNVRIVDNKIEVPELPALIKQAAFYRKQNYKHSMEKNNM